MSSIAWHDDPSRYKPIWKYWLLRHSVYAIGAIIGLILAQLMVKG